MARTEDKPLRRPGTEFRGYYHGVPIFDVEVGVYEGVIFRDLDGEGDIIDLVEHNGVWMTPEEAKQKE